MEYTNIPGLDEKVSRVALGTWAIGGWMWGGTDEEESIRTIHAALDRGINTIDTAPVYGFGRSEEIVGRALEQWKGQKPVISTKAALAWDEEGGGPWRNSTPERIRKEVEDSLRRLKVDVIDIYYIHWPDPLTPIEVTAETMEELRRAGKIRAIGVSNYHPEQMDPFRTKATISLNQPPYNIFEREMEEDILPYCRDEGIATMTYGALCRGLLSGKMTREREFRGDDLRNVDPKFQPPLFDEYLDAVEKLDLFARERFERRVIHLAVRYILDKGIDVALWGGRRPDQMDPLPRIFGWSLSPSDIETIENIVRETISEPVPPKFMAPPDREGKVPEA